MLGCTWNAVGLLLVTTKCSVCPDSLAPAEILVPHGALYGVPDAATVTFPPEVNDGAWLTGVILIVIESVAVLSPPVPVLPRSSVAIVICPAPTPLMLGEGV